MLRDVFYYGRKPNVHPREQFAENLADARTKATTRDFWIINEFCDYRNFDWDFDFEFLPDEDVWAEDHNNVWPSQHQKDSGTWLCPKEHSDLIIYRGDVDPVIRKTEKTANWVELDLIDSTKFDFSWHPDPTARPYIYKWPCKFFPAEFKHVLEYRVPGATQPKYMKTIAELLPENDRWVEHQAINKGMFDLSWRPNPLDPPFIYVWGNKYIDGTLKPTLEYHTPGATDKKYMSELVSVLPETDRWNVIEDIDKSSFDFTWRPDPREPAFIYVFGNEQHNGTIMPTVEYHCPDATEVKYVDEIKAKLASRKELFEHLEDSYGIDYSWRPDPTSPPYIYAWGNQWNAPEDKVSIQFVVSGATEYKYMSERAIRKPCMDNWFIPNNIDTTGFDFSWEPSPAAPPYIYEFGTQWQKTGGPQYIVPGATEKQHVDFQKVRILPSLDNWDIPKYVDVTEFDFSWHPDDTDPDYTYQFGTQWALSGGPKYVVNNATEVKYLDYPIAKALPDKTNWIYDDSIDTDSFDFSWHPYVEDQPYVYEFGTQWQKTGGPKYITPGADSSNPVKYIDTRILRATRLPLKGDSHWVTHYPIKEFDYSWHPDDTEEPYIYVFGNNQYQAEECVTVEYRMEGATQIKYIHDIVATLDVDMSRWVVPENVDTTDFDFSWIPNPSEPAYIYEFGTQWQKTGGPKYIVPGATVVKYIDVQAAASLPDISKFTVLNNYKIKNFDYSWHPDDTEEPYIYVFGNNQYSAEDCPTIQYSTAGATQIKYVSDIIATLDADIDNWNIPENINVGTFDFTWVPNPNDPPYIYEFATQWQKTGGPKYIVPGATVVKYIDVQKVTYLPVEDNWTIPNYIDKTSFDFSWHPDATEEPFIYVFATQWAFSGGPSYTVPGATEIKYVEEQLATALPDKTNWVYNESEIDVDSFDFSWHPYVEDQPYIYEFGTQWQKTGGPQYITPGADSSSPIKYIDTRILKATRLPNENANWQILYGYRIKNFDYSWHPDNTEEPYIYVFGNNQYSAEEMPTIQYTVPGATEYKYVSNSIAELDVDMNNWTVPTNVDQTTFDFSWHPNPSSPPYIYEFATVWNERGGPVYTVPGATEYKYIEDIKAGLLSDTTPWEILTGIDSRSFDFSWVPHPEDPPYIYVFGNQWHGAEKMPTVKYNVPGATEIKYVSTIIATLKPDMTNWIIPKDIVIKDFDFSWVPDPYDPPYNYIFGNQWYPAEEMATVTYVVPGGIEDKFVSDIVATLGKNSNNWEIPQGVDVRKFDFSWIPHPAASPYVYQFGTSSDPKDGPIYRTPGTTGEIIYVPRIEIDAEEDVVMNKYLDIPSYYINTSLEDLISEHPEEVFWALRNTIDYSDFDFDWRPNITQIQYVHVFGSSASVKSQSYLINAAWWNQGLREFNFVDPQDTETGESLDVFFVDRGNPESAARFEALKAKYGTKIQKTRYLNSWVDTINRCANRATSSLVWVLNSELDYDDFNFDYYPNPWQMKMVHVFGTQWSHWGTTFLVNRETFRDDTKYIKIIEHLNNLNFVKELRAKATKCSHDIVVIDHGNKETTDVVSTLKSKAPDRTVTTIKYNNSYLDTLREVIKRQPEKKDNFIWVCSSVCDYTGFDFTYIIDPFARDNLHVFPSGKQKFGDTFFIDVTNAREVINELDKLENFTKVNYNGTVKAERLREPIIVVNDDTLTNSVDKITDFPYATLITSDNVDIGKVDIEPMNLWSAETKNIYVTSTGATRIIAPKEIKNHVTKELYEYPYIKRAPKLSLSNPLDIVFLSNGETGAEENYEHLLNITKNLPNRVVRVDGVNGRAAAYHAAAEASETPWMFTVFAKLKVSPKFDFNWQPDRMQVPKHYIFHAKNPVNGLVYGHQAMIAYNKKLTLANDGKGLDFTLDNEHEVVPLISGTAQYNTDEFSTWRTAFREVIKLRADDSEVSKERLDAWLNKAEGDFAQYSIKGALDADEYYDEVDGDFDQLKLSYEWAWLREKFDQI